MGPTRANPRTKSNIQEVLRRAGIQTGTESRLSVSAVIADDPLARDHRLLMLRRSDPPESLEIPGGGVDIKRVQTHFGKSKRRSETLSEALRREVREETGLELDKILAYLSTHEFISQTHKIHTIQLAFFASVLCPNTVTLSYEHTEYGWLTKGELLAPETWNQITERSQIALSSYWELQGRQAAAHRKGYNT
ncbi:MAG: NUDIX hydrolase [Candidatus Marsarchaeota archaeon]|nr:NUDIX hydrolase [Candidatus Marsarchaeota archaeon]